MRSYIRHPSDIPIQVQPADCALRGVERLNNVSYGGLSFNSHTALADGTLISIRIPVVRPEFEVHCRVTWSKPRGDHYEIGVEFLDRDDLFRVRMVEQVCHIEHYKKLMYEQEGRRLSAEQAAMEWIARYAQDFPRP